MFKQVLVVCIGNICRSPTAEFLLRERLKQSDAPQVDVRVASAGLHAMVGYPVDATAAQVMREHGLDGAAHRARQLTTTMLRDADVVLVMERSHITAVRRMAPEFSDKIFLLGKWQRNARIADPYGQQREAFDHAYQLIERSVAAWVPRLQAP